MTPVEIMTFARRKYNAVSDDFYSDAEIYDMIYQAEMELALETQCIEVVLTASTVAAQQEYSFPTNLIAIKRVEYNGRKLEKLAFREDDIITNYDQDTTASGTPEGYMFWNEVLYLRPIPAAVGTLRILGYSEPGAVTAVSTLEVPSRYHLDISDFILIHFNAKDKNYQGASYYQAKWDQAKLRARKWEMKRKRTDAFAHSIPDEALGEHMLGVNRW